MAPAAPFHILMLPGGRTKPPPSMKLALGDKNNRESRTNDAKKVLSALAQRSPKGGTGATKLGPSTGQRVTGLNETGTLKRPPHKDEEDGIDEGDYMERRNRHKKRKVEKLRLGKKNRSTKLQLPETEDADNVEPSGSCWSGTSSLERDIASCCEPLTSTADEEPQSGESGADQDGVCDGAVCRGSEGQFVALMTRRCLSLQDRSLILAVLERTIARDKRDRINPPNRISDETITTADDGHLPTQISSKDSSVCKDTTKDRALDEISNTNDKSCSRTTIENRRRRQNDRMVNILSAGGLKVLNHWLIDAFTPRLSDTGEKEKAGKKGERGRRNKGKNDNDDDSFENGSDDEDKDRQFPSTTGAILPLLLSVLKVIPFDMELVKETQINKQIRKLKKALDRIVADFEMEFDDIYEHDNEEDDEYFSEDGYSCSHDHSSSQQERQKRRKQQALEKLTHPVSGGMPVLAVQVAVEELMKTWKGAATNSGNKKRPASKDMSQYFRALKATMLQRFEALSNYESGEGSKPPWLTKFDTKSPLGTISPSFTKSSATASSLSSSVHKKMEPSSTGARLIESAKKKKALCKKREDFEAAAAALRRDEARRRLQERETELKLAQAARLQAKERIEEHRRKMKEGSRNKVPSPLPTEILSPSATTQADVYGSSSPPISQRSRCKSPQHWKQPVSPLQQNGTPKRRVTWADQWKDIDGVPKQPLADVRIFVKEVDVYDDNIKAQTEGQETGDEDRIELDVTAVEHGTGHDDKPKDVIKRHRHTNRPNEIEANIQSELLSLPQSPSFTIDEAAVFKQDPDISEESTTEQNVGKKQGKEDYGMDQISHDFTQGADEWEARMCDL